MKKPRRRKASLPEPPAPSSAPPRDKGLLRRAGIASLLVAAGLAAYSNSFGGEFVFDDSDAIVQNRSIRQLWPPWDALRPPRDSTVAGRPLLNLSFALNYRAGGLRPAGYHALNLVIHLLAGLALYGIARRTLAGARLRDRFGADADGLATGISLVWLLHPLHTGAVTYVVQRAESLMGLFFLAALYASIRSFESPSAAWRVAAVAACAFGMGTKEVMAAAPLVILLYDRVFSAGSFEEALRRRRVFYSALASTWAIAGALAVASPRARSAGFGVEGLQPLEYARTQITVLVHYLRLALWPDRLIFHYSWPVARSFAEVARCALVLGVVAAASWWAWRRAPALGFAAISALLILAPSSSIVPIVTEIAAEHRMYLPLASIAAIVAACVYVAAERACRAIRVSARTRNAACLGLLLASAASFGYRTWSRNRDYATGFALWSDTVRKQPANALALNNLAVAWRARGDHVEAERLLREAIRVKPDYALARVNLGWQLERRGESARALEEYRAAVAARPRHAAAHSSLGAALERSGDLAGALAHLGEALRLEPELASAHANLAAALDRKGAYDRALDHYREALRLEPDNPEFHYNLGLFLSERGRIDEAARQYAETLRLDPRLAPAANSLGAALGALGRLDAAVERYGEAVALDPSYAEAHSNLGVALAAQGRLDAAIASYRRALALRPDYASAHNNLAIALSAKRDYAAAIEHYKEALRIRPDYSEAHNNLGVALAGAGRPREAVEHYRAALALKEDYAAAHSNLAAALFALGDYREAWKHVQLCRRHGGTPPPALVDQLSRKTPEPKT